LEKEKGHSLEGKDFGAVVGRKRGGREKSHPRYKGMMDKKSHPRYKGMMDEKSHPRKVGSRSDPRQEA